LRTIGNAAFYQTENLHRYVFLGSEAPLLEGVYSTDYSMVLYATFYDYYFNDFGDFYVYAVVPDGATGYDSWIYNYFFYAVYSLKDEPAYQQPASETIAPVTETKPSEEETTDDYEEKFTAYIAELVKDTDLDELTIAQLNKLLQQFKDDYNAFFDVIEEVPAFGEQFYQGYVSEANSIYLNKTELYAYRWNKLYELDNLVATCLAKNTYNSSYRQTLLALPYSIHNSILDLSDIATIDEYYEYYKAFIEGIPTENGETAFSTYCKEKAAALQAEFDKLDKTLYDEDVYTFISEKFNTYLGQVNSAISTAQVDDAIQAWKNIAENTVKAADRAAFEAEKAAWIEKLNSYSEDDYEYSLWVNIQAYIEKQIGYMDDTYILASIRSIAQFTIGQVEAQTTKLDSRKATAKAKIETIVENYAMYSNLFENEASVLRSIVAQVLSELDGATTVEELQTLTESGFGRIWAYYEYNQKAYTVYRQALEAFASLTGEAKEEAMNALESISYRVASNYSAIQALIDYYCAGENV
jgi:hypothetical protein